MPKRRTVPLVALLVLSLASPAAGEPGPKTQKAVRQEAFGFASGMTLSRVSALASVEKLQLAVNQYVTSSPPKPVWPLAKYVLYFRDSQLCAVGAISEAAPSESQRSAFALLFSRMKRKYGRPTSEETPNGMGGTDTVVRWEEAQGPGTRIALGAGNGFVSAIYEWAEDCMEDADGL